MVFSKGRHTAVVAAKIKEGESAVLFDSAPQNLHLSPFLEQILNNLGRDQNPLEGKSYNFTLDIIPGFALPTNPASQSAEISRCTTQLKQY